MRHPVYRTPAAEVALSLALERLSHTTFLLGEPASLVPGAVNGESIVTALRAAAEWVWRTQDRVLAARSRFTVGLDFLDATIHDDGQPDSRFFAWLGQFQIVQRLPWRDIQVLARADLQLANDALLSLEQLAVGGRYSVRGYRENTLVRDNAMLASFESRIPLFRRASGEEILQLAQFLDYGRAYDNKVPDPEPSFLASVGLGLLWNILPMNRAHFEVYWGVPLNHVPQPGGNLQDHGIHLQLVVQAL